MYSDKVFDAFLNPKHIGRLDEYDVKSFVGSIECGDALELTLKIEKQVIKDAKFLVYGCPAAIATSDIMVDLILNKNINEVMKIKNTHIVEQLKGLPDIKVHCSVMAEEVLQKALNIYLGNDVLELDDEIICKCNKTTRRLIERVIVEDKVYSYKKLVENLKIGKICGKCENRIYNILNKSINAHVNFGEIN